MRNPSWRQAVAWAATVAALAGPTAATAAERVRVSGELVDTWCAISGIMFAYGTAHHQCAVWCAVGGIPVSIRADDGTFYMVLRLEAMRRASPTRSWSPSRATTSRSTATSMPGTESTTS